MSLKSLALLSHKRGVGKTIIAVNLAVHLTTPLAMVFLQEGTVEEIAEKSGITPDVARQYLTDLNKRCLIDIKQKMEKCCIFMHFNSSAIEKEISL